VYNKTYAGNKGVQRTIDTTITMRMPDMKQISVLFIALITFLQMGSDAFAYYMEVDSLSMNRVGSTLQCQTGNNRYLIQEFLVTNTGSTDLYDVGVAFTFMYSGGWGFEYDGASHTWQREIVFDGQSYGTHSLEVFTQCPFDTTSQQTYLSLSRDNTNLSLCGFASNRSTDIPLLLDETDEIPVFWLGDLSAGESASFAWFAIQGPYISPASNSAWSFNLQNGFVADSRTTVPLVGSIWFLLGGLVALRKKRKMSVLK
jgi:hypothetical protein